MLQGSFWTAFGARLGATASSGLDEILERDHVELEDLLDHDDVIQECKYMNAQLIELSHTNTTQHTALDTTAFNTATVTPWYIPGPYPSHPHCLDGCVVSCCVVLCSLSTKSSIEKLVRYVITLPGDEEMSSEQKDEAMNPSSSTSSSTATITPSSSSSPTPMDTDSDSSSTHHDAPHPLTPISEDSSMRSSPYTSSETKEEEVSTPVDPRQRPNYPKYPYVASELFACEVTSMLDVLFEFPQLLDLLFTFLDHPTPMDPSHASYFRKVMVVLIQRKYDPLVKYIQSHHIIDKLVAHIGLYSIMEILIMIGWDDGLGQVNDVEWLYKENLIPKLVAKLTPEYEQATDVHMNAARALVDVVVKCLTGDHQVLTRSGWRSIQHIAVNEEVASYNTATCAMEWKKVLATQSFLANTEAKLFRMEGRGMDIIATKDHRMLLARISADGLSQRKPFAYETVDELLQLTYRGVPHLESSPARAVLRSGINRQPAYQLAIPGMEAVCNWWWQKDQQMAFLRFLGFWLRDGHLQDTHRTVGVSQRKGESTAWLVDLLNEVFPRCWCRIADKADASVPTSIYHIRCPPLYDWLRVMAAGPEGYNPRDPSALRSYPHFTFDQQLKVAEAQSRYRRPGASPHNTWTEAEMLEAMQSEERCCWCKSTGGVEGDETFCCAGVRADGLPCRSGGHLSCSGLTGVPEGDWLCPYCDDVSEEVVEREVAVTAVEVPKVVGIEVAVETAVDDDAEDDDVAALEDDAAAQAAGKICFWNEGKCVIINDHWFHLKRWLGPNVAGTFSHLSKQQAGALLEGFHRTDSQLGTFQVDETTGAPIGRWRCSHSSFPLIQHLQLIGQLAGAKVSLELANEAGSIRVTEGRKALCAVHHWQLTCDFSTMAHVPVPACMLAKPVDVSTNIDARGYYEYKDDGRVYDITVEDNGNFLTQRLSRKRLRDGRLGVKALSAFVGNCPPSSQNLLISHLQSTEVLSVIFSHMFSDSLSSLTNSMSIIIVLVQRYANANTESAANKSAGDRGGGGDDKATSSTGEADAPLEEPFASLQPHLHKIIALLHQPQAEVKVQFGKSQPFGETRMKVVELTLVLLRSRLPAVDRQLSELKVLSLMLESFFLYPWNNMLHGLVESIVRTVLDSESEVLRHSLFVDGELVDRFVAAYERSERESTEKGGYRLGYMGHLLRTSMAIEDVARKSDETRKALLGDQSEKWTQFVNNQLEKENEKQKVVAPFVGGDEDILDGLQFELAGMNTDNQYMQGTGEGRNNLTSGGGGGGGDGYDFTEADDDENGGGGGSGGGMGYDYTHSYTIRDPDTEYDDPAAESEDVWRSGATSNASNDDWGNNFSTHFSSEDSHASDGKKGEFDRGGPPRAGRQIIEFGQESRGEDEDDDFVRNGIPADDPFAVVASEGC